MTIGYPVELWRLRYMASLADGAADNNISFKWNDFRGVIPYLIHHSLLWGCIYLGVFSHIPKLASISLSLTVPYPFHTISVRMALKETDYE